MLLRFLSTSLVIALLAPGCADVPTTDTATNTATEVSRLSLSAELANPVGVTINPQTGTRFVLDADRGIFELGRTGILTQVWALPEAGPGVAVPSVNDLCAVTDRQLMVIGSGDGYRLDLDAGATLEQHFCLEPGWDGFEWEPTDPDPADPVEPGVVTYRQRSFSVSCDLGSNLIYAQPRTEEVIDGQAIPFLAHVASYALTTGEDLTWSELPDADLRAGAMVQYSPQVMLLGRGSRLLKVTLDGAGRAELASEIVVDLAPLGIEAISGLALDPSTDTVLVLDAMTATLVEIAIE
jgi:hypothetical protein